MSDIGPEKSTVTIRQKINPAQPQISHAEQAFQKSLHKALAQKALSLFGLKVKIQEHRIAKVPVSELAEITEQYVMLTLLENSGSEPGFVAFDDAALAGFVTMQTLGCVLPNLTKRPDRNFNRCCPDRPLDRRGSGFDAAKPRFL